MKRRKGWRMSCDLGEVTVRLENELCYDYNYELCSFSNLSFTSPTSQLILQTFHRFTYVTAHSPTLPLLYLRHSSFSNPSFTSPTSQALHLIHLVSRPGKNHYGGRACLVFIGSLGPAVQSNSICNKNVRFASRTTLL